MMKMVFAAALIMSAVSAPVFAAETPAKPEAKSMKMHKMAKPMKASATPVMKPAREPSTDKLNQQQLDSFKKS